MWSAIKDSDSVQRGINVKRGNEKTTSILDPTSTFCFYTIDLMSTYYILSYSQLQVDASTLKYT